MSVIGVIYEFTNMNATLMSDNKHVMSRAFRFYYDAVARLAVFGSDIF